LKKYELDISIDESFLHLILWIMSFE
jgi:hypothetical protein